MNNEYLKLPRLLIHGDKYRDLSSASQILYAFLYNQLCNKYIVKSSCLSVAKGYDDIYITFSNGEISQRLNISQYKVIKSKKELIQCDLLKIEKKPYQLDKLYLKVI